MRNEINMTPTDIAKQIQEALEKIRTILEGGLNRKESPSEYCDPERFRVPLKIIDEQLLVNIPNLLAHLEKGVSLMECAVAAANVTRKRYGLNDISLLSKDVDYRIFDETKAVLDRAGVKYHD